MRTALLLAVLLACSTSSSQLAGAAPDPGAARPGEGLPCGDRTCAPGLRCVRYFGIAGSKGPMLSSCEIPCSADGSCPEGQRCVTIADGPGRVCRRAR